MLEHSACCVDLIKFTSVLFAVGLVALLYLCSAVCRVSTTPTQISDRTGGPGLGSRKTDTSKLLGRLAANGGFLMALSPPMLKFGHVWLVGV